MVPERVRKRHDLELWINTPISGHMTVNFPPWQVAKNTPFFAFQLGFSKYCLGMPKIFFLGFV